MSEVAIPDHTTSGDLMGLLSLAGPFILEAELSNPDAGTGAAKLDQVTEKMAVLIEAKGGLDFPGIVPQWVHRPFIRGAVQLCVTGLKWAGMDAKIQALRDFFTRYLGMLLPPS